ncbi:hypothetical protein ACJX0J_018965, partial [Zea mays]
MSHLSTAKCLYHQTLYRMNLKYQPHMFTQMHALLDIYKFTGNESPKKLVFLVLVVTICHATSLNFFLLQFTPNNIVCIYILLFICLVVNTFLLQFTPKVQ